MIRRNHGQKEYKSLSIRMLELFAVVERKQVNRIVFSEKELGILYRVARNNGLCAFTAYALSRENIHSERFKLALAQAQRKSILYDVEYEKLTKRFEEYGVEYLPLKGILLKQIYPAPYLREMSDIDILFWNASPELIRDIMLSEGYTLKLFNKNNHDVYIKQSFFCVEMHRMLFDEKVYKTISEYFCQKSYTAVLDSSHQHEMTVSEMYLYLLAHTYIHYISAGTGLRSLLDFYYFFKHNANEIDEEYVSRELRSIGLVEFEKMIRVLSMDILDPAALSEDKKEQLDYFIFSGTHGNESYFIRNRMNSMMTDINHSKTRYLLKRLSYDEAHIKNSPFYSKHPRFAPLLYFTRPIKVVMTRPKSVFKELKELRKSK